ncbi:MAG: hypothetical protein WCA89_14620, partial [Terracidiphilus sp.]
MATQAIIPQPTGNPILDNPALRAAFMAAQGGAQQPQQPQGATMPPAGQQPPPQVSLPDAPMTPPAPSKQPVVLAPFGQKSGPVAQRGTQERDEQERERLLSTGSGLSQIHSRIESAMPNHTVLGKVLGIGAQGLATLGDIGLRTVLPITESMIPGTAGYHAAQLGHVNQALTQDIGNAGKEAETGNLQSEISLHEAQAKNMPLQQQLTAGEQGLKVDSNGRLVPQSQEEQSPGFKTQEELKQAQIYGLKNPWAKLPDKEPLGNTEAINAGLTDRYQVLHPGKPLPPEFTLPSNATKGDFERLDKLLSSTESAAGTQAQRETANQMRAQTYALAMWNSQNAQQARQAGEDAKKMKWVMGTNSGGETIAAPLSQAETMGLTNLAELPSTELKDMFNARHAVKLATQVGDPKAPETMGTLQLMDSLEKDGKLGVAASRINKFLTRGVGSEPGDDPRIAALLNKGDLFTTGIMLAHFGASGGRSPQMLQHFLEMADTGKMDGPTLKSGTKALVNYMQERAMESHGGNQPAQGSG